DPSNFLMDLYLTQSFDGGLTFEPNVRVTTVSSDPTAGSGRAGLIGEYTGLAASSSSCVHPVWTDTREGHQDVYTSIVDTTFVGVPDDGAVAVLHLFPPSPNPSRGDALLHLLAPPARAVTVTICDISGRFVRELRAVPGTDGTCSVVWDGTDGAGQGVASGVYFVRAADGASAATEKLVHLR
ncbi:MAG: T9SS type A sorting domain-containing protein, partial [Candidatus Eisenbacteria sp.]|nr:T9SS type A sorting domain-containing protein [Candidatus Eisenbacteria bacterium]